MEVVAHPGANWHPQALAVHPCTGLLAVAAHRAVLLYAADGTFQAELRAIGAPGPVTALTFCDAPALHHVLAVATSRSVRLFDHVARRVIADLPTASLATAAAAAAAAAAENANADAVAVAVADGIQHQQQQQQQHQHQQQTAVTTALHFVPGCAGALFVATAAGTWAVFDATSAVTSASAPRSSNPGAPTTNATTVLSSGALPLDRVFATSVAAVATRPTAFVAGSRRGLHRVVSLDLRAAAVRPLYDGPLVCGLAARARVDGAVDVALCTPNAAAPIVLTVSPDTAGDTQPAPAVPQHAHLHPHPQQVETPTGRELPRNTLAWAIPPPPPTPPTHPLATTLFSADATGALTVWLVSPPSTSPRDARTVLDLASRPDAHARLVHAVAAGPGGMLVTASTDRSLRAWRLCDPPSGTALRRVWRTLPAGVPVRTLAVSHVSPSALPPPEEGEEEEGYDHDDDNDSNNNNNNNGDGDGGSSGGGGRRRHRRRRHHRHAGGFVLAYPSAEGIVTVALRLRDATQKQPPKRARWHTQRDAQSQSALLGEVVLPTRKAGKRGGATRLVLGHVVGARGTQLAAVGVMDGRVGVLRQNGAALCGAQALRGENGGEGGRSARPSWGETRVVWGLGLAPAASARLCNDGGGKQGEVRHDEGAAFAALSADGLYASGRVSEMAGRGVETDDTVDLAVVVGEPVLAACPAQRIAQGDGGGADGAEDGHGRVLVVTRTRFAFVQPRGSSGKGEGKIHAAVTPVTAMGPPRDGAIAAVAVSTDGRLLAAATGADGRTLLVSRLRHDGADNDNDVVWHATLPKRAVALACAPQDPAPGASPPSAEPSADADDRPPCLVAVVDAAGDGAVWEAFATNGLRVRASLKESAGAVAVAAWCDAVTLATGGTDRCVRLWHVARLPRPQPRVAASGGGATGRL